MYSKYEQLGLNDYKLRTVEQVKLLLGYDLYKIKGLEVFDESEVELIQRLIINYYNGWGVNSRLEKEPKKVEKVTEEKYKVIFENGYSYLYKNGEVG